MFYKFKRRAVTGERANNLYCLPNKERIEREKKELERQRRRGEERPRFNEGTGGDVSGHELSLVTTATDKKRARP